MTERREPMPEPIGEVEGNQGFVWEKVFLAVTELAKKHQIDVNQFAPQFSIPAIEDDSEYTLRINPAIISSEGNLEVLVTDIYYGDVHSQQWVTKTKWEKGKPKVTGVDSSSIQTAGRYFNPEEAATLSERLIRTELDVLDNSGGVIVRGRNFRIFNNPSNVIH